MKRKNEIINLLQDSFEQHQITLGWVMDYVCDFGDNNQKLIITNLCNDYRTALRNNPTDIDFLVKLRTQLIDFLLAIQVNNEVENTKQCLVEVKNICKSFGGNSFMLSDINLNIRQGEIMGIVGANANGKSTLIKIITGHLIQDKGTVSFPVWQPNQQKNNWQKIKKKIAYLPQELPIWNGSLRENIAFEATLHGLKGNENDIAVNYILERLALSEYVNAKWQELSGGYKLHYALARALVWQPELLILDEPLANLDINAQLVVLADLKALASSMKNPVGIVLTSQHIHEVELVADQIVVIDKGILTYQGFPQSFQNHQEENVFEFHTSLTFNELKASLNEVGIRQLKQKGAYFIVYVSQSMSSEDFLQIVSEKRIPMLYFRDISHSVKQLFL